MYINNILLWIIFRKRENNAYCVNNWAIPDCPLIYIELNFFFSLSIQWLNSVIYYVCVCVCVFITNHEINISFFKKKRIKFRMNNGNIWTLNLFSVQKRPKYNWISRLIFIVFFFLLLTTIYNLTILFIRNDNVILLMKINCSVIRNQYKVITLLQIYIIYIYCASNKRRRGDIF